MGLFGGSSKSKSTQDTDVNAANQQGSGGALLTNSGNNAVLYKDVSGSNIGKVGNAGTILEGNYRSKINVVNANADKLAEIAAEISTSALDYYDKQNQRSIKLAEEVAKATTASNKDIVTELAAITEKNSQSEALTLNEQILKYGVVGLIGFYILQGVKRA